MSQSHSATLLANGQVLVAGGYPNTPAAEIWDPVTGSWSLSDSMSLSRTRHQATLLPDGRVLVTGGWIGCMTASAEVWDPVTGAWSATNSMSRPRADHVSVLLRGGWVLVAGGDDDCVGGERKTTSAELYDTVSGILNPEPIGRAWSALQRGRDEVALRLWAALMFQSWKQRWLS